MDFLSPERPTVAQGRPGYPWQKPIAALPAIKVAPTRDGWHLSLWLCTAQNEAREYHHYCTAMADMLQVLQAYKTAPEETMKIEFGWPGVGATPKQQRAVLAETDMGF